MTWWDDDYLGGVLYSWEYELLLGNPPEESPIFDRLLYAFHKARR